MPGCYPEGGSCYRDGWDGESGEVSMNLPEVLLILVAEAFVLVGVVLFLRMAAEQARVARRARMVARRARKQNNLLKEGITVTQVGAG